MELGYLQRTRKSHASETGDKEQGGVILPKSSPKPTGDKAQAQKLIAQTMSEEELQYNIIDLAGRLGWRVHAERPARTKDGGWRTPVQGDKGFPDLVLANEMRVLFAELKSQNGILSPEQTEWLRVLRLAHVKDFVVVWRPSDWLDGTVERLLRDGYAYLF